MALVYLGCRFSYMCYIVYNLQFIIWYCLSHNKPAVDVDDRAGNVTGIF